MGLGNLLIKERGKQALRTLADRLLPQGERDALTIMADEAVHAVPRTVNPALDLGQNVIGSIFESYQPKNQYRPRLFDTKGKRLPEIAPLAEAAGEAEARLGAPASLALRFATPIPAFTMKMFRGAPKVERGSNIMISDSGHYGVGRTFSESADVAKVYANKSKGVVKEELVELNNPFVIDYSTIEAADKTKTLANKIGLELNAWGAAVDSTKFTKKLKSSGYDGVVVRRQNDPLEVIVFDQSKLIGKVGSNLKDDDVLAAIKGTPGVTLSEEGLTLELARRQKPGQSGEVSTRSGLFFLPKKDPTLSRFYGAKRKEWYGGPEKKEVTKTYNKPYYVKGHTGSKVPNRAVDEIVGKGTSKQIEEETYELIDKYRATDFKSRHLHQDIEELFKKYDLDDAELVNQIVYVQTVHNRTNPHNFLVTSIKESIQNHLIRKEGYDSVIGISKFKDPKKKRITEVIDLKDTIYPAILLSAGMAGGELKERMVKKNELKE